MINPIQAFSFHFRPSQFQFHIGMINPATVTGELRSYPKFQFHIGMINPPPGRLCYTLFSRFQFHIGMINPQAILTDMRSTSIISIPHWYD